MINRTTVLLTNAFYSIELQELEHTCTVIICDGLGSELQRIAVDPMDRTVAATIHADALKKLIGFGGPAKQQFIKESFLHDLSEVLRTQLGAKQLIVTPSNINLEGYVPPAQHAFKRLRHANREALQKSTAEFLKQYPDLTRELDAKNLQLTNTRSDLFKQDELIETYQRLYGMLEQGRFTSEKQDEYQNGALQGVVSRFRSHHVRPIAIRDQQGQFFGIVRALHMGSRFVYLSDDIVNQDTIAHEKFAGKDADEQKKNRNAFLLAYFMHQACKKGLAGYEHLVIIASAGREDIFDQIGFNAVPESIQGFNIEGWTLSMSFGAPGPVLAKVMTDIKEAALPEEKKFPIKVVDTLFEDVFSSWGLGPVLTVDELLHQRKGSM